MILVLLFKVQMYLANRLLKTHIKDGKNTVYLLCKIQSVLMFCKKKHRFFNERFIDELRGGKCYTCRF